MERVIVRQVPLQPPRQAASHRSDVSFCQADGILGGPIGLRVAFGRSFGEYLAPPPSYNQADEGGDSGFVIVAHSDPAISKPRQVIGHQLYVLVQSGKVTALGGKNVGIDTLLSLSAK